MQIIELCYTTAKAVEAKHVVSEKWNPVHNCSARIQFVQVEYTRYEDTGCRPTRKKSSTAGPCTGEGKVGNVRWLIFGGPWRYILICLYLVDRASFITSLLLFQLDTLLFSFFTFTVFLYMFRTGWSIIRRIKCLITRAASGTVPCNMRFSNYRVYLVCCIAFVTVFNMSEFCGYGVTLVLLCG